MPTPINLSPNQPSILAHNLPDLVEAYMVDTRSRVKPLTAASYDYLLGILLEWWAEAADSVNYILDPHAWRLFERWLAQRPSYQSCEPIAYNTRDCVMKRCKQMLRWAYRRNYLDRDYSDQISPAQGEPPTRKAPSLDDLNRLMQASAKSRKPLRDQAILALFIGTGMRRAEAAGLNIENIHFHADHSGTIHIRKGKGGKSRDVVFDAICGEYIMSLLEEIPHPTGPLLVGWNDRRLSPGSVYKAVKHAMQLAGIDNRGAGPHDLRRAFVTTWTRHRRGMGYAQPLSLQLGHTTAAMTVHYSLQDIDDIYEVFVSPFILLADSEKKQAGGQLLK